MAKQANSVKSRESHLHVKQSQFLRMLSHDGSGPEECVRAKEKKNVFRYKPPKESEK